MKENIRVRFAPSPTGYLHVGGLRTALYNYLFARKANGTFILRIEDTDRSRYVDGAVENLLATLKKVGLEYDEGPFFQSHRNDLYSKYSELLIAQDSAYHCFCTSEELETMREEQRSNKQDARYDGRCRNLSQDEITAKIASHTPYVVRAKMPREGVVEFDDLIRGRISFRWEMVDDQVLLKSDGYPTYHLANVVDDHDMEITHIIRGEEWLTSCPKHIFLYNALGWETPVYAHLPLLLNPDKSKLSKRQGDVAVEDFLNKGFLPEAIINYVALLGWNPGDEREIFSLRELETVFSLERINKAGAVFDQEKLKWMNGSYIRSLSDDELAALVEPIYEASGIVIDEEAKFLKVVAYAKERINLLPDIIEETEMFYRDFTLQDNDTMQSGQAQELLQFWADEISKNPEISDEFINNLLKLSTEKLGVKGKNLYFPLRLALYGLEHGPNIPVLFAILGREKALQRIKAVITT